MLNIFLSITAFLGNTLILVALHKESTLHAPSKLLFRSLAVSDLCVGITVYPLFVTHLISVVSERWIVCRYAASIATFVVGYILGSVSLFTLTAISVHRLLALLLGLRYRQIVTLKRIHLALAVSWLISIVGSTMFFWNNLIAIWYGNIFIPLCLVISVFCYSNIFLNLRNYSIQVHNHLHQGPPRQTRPLNVARYRKTVSSALWVQLALVVCYTPCGVVEVSLSQTGSYSATFIAWVFSLTLVCLNSSLNPILYCWKIREVRQAVQDTVREFCSLSNQFLRMCFIYS